MTTNSTKHLTVGQGGCLTPCHPVMNETSKFSELHQYIAETFQHLANADDKFASLIIAWAEADDENKIKMTLMFPDAVSRIKDHPLVDVLHDFIWTPSNSLIYGNVSFGSVKEKSGVWWRTNLFTYGQFHKAYPSEAIAKTALTMMALDFLASAVKSGMKAKAREAQS